MGIRNALSVAAREVVAFAYIRISEDNEGDKASPKTQWDAIIETANRWDIPIPSAERVYRDLNLSASDSTVVRFSYRRLLKAISAIDSGRYEVVVLSYAQDRVYRQPADWQEFTELVRDELDGRLITKFDGNVDLTPSGVFGVGASYLETKKTAMRTRDGIHTSALNGGGHGTVGYGWVRQYDHSRTGKPGVQTVINETEATVIRRIARDLLAGKSLNAIVTALNDEAIPAPGAGKVLKRHPVTREPLSFAKSQWNPQTIRQILKRKANIGIREHTTGKGKRQVTTDHAASWDAILSDETYALVCAMFNERERLTTMSNTAKYLLTGIAMCGHCDRPIRTQVGRVERAEKTLRYRCQNGSMYKAMGPVDNIVVSEVLHILSQPEIRAALSAPPDDEAAEALAREAGLLARKNEASDDYAAGLIDRASFLRVSANIAEQIKAIRASVNRMQDVTVYADLLTTDDIETLWGSMPLDVQRSVVRALFTVRLMPNAQRGVNVFDPSTVIVSLKPMAEEQG